MTHGGSGGAQVVRTQGGRHALEVDVAPGVGAKGPQGRAADGAGAPTAGVPHRSPPSVSVGPNCFGSALAGTGRPPPGHHLEHPAAKGGLPVSKPGLDADTHNLAARYSAFGGSHNPLFRDVSNTALARIL